MEETVWHVSTEKQSYECPFCHRPSTVDDNDAEMTVVTMWPASALGFEALVVTQAVCPSVQCGERMIRAELHSIRVDQQGNPQLGRIGYSLDKNAKQSWQLRPASRARKWADYVPTALQRDYEEACLIEELSPKASATLARRCLQQITRGYFKVKPGNLNDELMAIKGELDATLWQAIDGLRAIGNLGAHPEKDVSHIVDVEPGEAAATIRLIELLIEATYVADDRNARILAEVQAIADNKKAERDAKNL